MRGEVCEELRPQPREADQPEGVDQQRGKPPAEVEAPQGHRRIPQRPQASSRRSRKSCSLFLRRPQRYLMMINKYFL